MRFNGTPKRTAAATNSSAVSRLAGLLLLPPRRRRPLLLLPPPPPPASPAPSPLGRRLASRWAFWARQVPRIFNVACRLASCRAAASVDAAAGGLGRFVAPPPLPPPFARASSSSLGRDRLLAPTWW